MESVQRGAKLLDEKVPGWWRRINVETLAMKDCSLCMLGQLFGHDVETALGAEIFGLPIKPELDAPMKKVSKFYTMTTMIPAPTTAETLLFTHNNGFVRGKQALGIDGYYASYGCGNTGRCEWIAEIAKRRAEEADGVPAPEEGG